MAKMNISTGNSTILTKSDCAGFCHQHDLLNGTFGIGAINTVAHVRAAPGDHYGDACFLHVNNKQVSHLHILENLIFSVLILFQLFSPLHLPRKAHHCEVLRDRDKNLSLRRLLLDLLLLLCCRVHFLKRQTQKRSSGFFTQKHDRKES